MKRTRKPKPRKPTGRPPLYPWDRWFGKGNVFTLDKGRDYTCTTEHMIRLIRNHASKVRKASLRITTDPVGITVVIRRKPRRK